MNVSEEVSLLRGLVSVAVADGLITRSERGMYQRLAERAGVGRMSLEAMIERFKTDPKAREDSLSGPMSQPELAMEIMVAAAQIDGQIQPEERAVLIALSEKLGLPSEKFAQIVQRGIHRAQAARGQRKANQTG